MKQEKLFHPRVFDEQEWAEGYYNRNKKSIAKVGKRLAIMLKKQGFKPGRILDVGCGFGSVAIELAKAFPESEIIGVDLGEPLLDMGRKLIKDEALEEQIRLEKGDAMKLGFADKQYDLVVNTFLLHIVEEPLSMLNEIERVTKTNGRIIITDLRRGFLALLIKKFKTAYTLKEASDILEQSSIRKGAFSKGPFWWDYVV
jgi:ubiquinone/menaquinone biosynthesis C-methylase UbiE